MKRKSFKKKLQINKREWLTIIGKSIGVVIFLDYFFFKSFWAVIPLSVFGIAFFVLSYRELIERKQKEATEQFKELLLLSCNGLRAGYSVENAMLSSYRDLETLYSSKSFVTSLLSKLQIAKNNNRSLPMVFQKIGEESGIGIISEFGITYKIAYEMSGNLPEVMEKCAQNIIERMDTESEVQKVLNERIFEMKIMSLMPFLIIEYMSLINRGYFEVLYKGVLGRIIMSICLLIYAGAYLWGCRITDIKM